MRKLITLLSVLFCVAAYGQNTTRNKLKANPGLRPEVSVRYDTLSQAAASRYVVFTGYEKPLRSTKETVLLHLNEDAPDVKRVIFDIEYLDLSGKVLHKRTVDLPVEVRPGGTRMCVFKSWDVNKVFYYHINKPPRTSAQGTPYSINLDLKSALVLRAGE
ncbi:MAG: hypothetical protein ACI30O_07125 [Muribaculaceae bacterium]